MGFNQNSFNTFILDNNVVGFFDSPIQLKSGRTSNWYVNWRPITSDAYLIDQLSRYILEFVKDKNIPIDCFYGVPEGATKLGIITQFRWAESQDWSKGTHILPMGRSKAKEHGADSDRFFIGKPQGKTIVLEDVTTTGGSLIATLQQLKASNVDISAAIGMTNRMEKRDDGQSVSDAIQAMDIPYYEMSKATDLLPGICQKLNPNKTILDAIQKEFQTYGTSCLTL